MKSTLSWTLFQHAFSPSNIFSGVSLLFNFRVICVDHPWLLGDIARQVLKSIKEEHTSHPLCNICSATCFGFQRRVFWSEDTSLTAKVCLLEEKLWQGEKKAFGMIKKILALQIKHKPGLEKLPRALGMEGMPDVIPSGPGRRVLEESVRRISGVHGC